MKKEKEALRKEKRAERAERVYLAEEETEKKTVKKKEDLARAVSELIMNSIIVLHEVYSLN